MPTLPMGDTLSTADIERAFASARSEMMVDGHAVSVLVGRDWRPLPIDAHPEGGFDGIRLAAGWAPPEPRGAGRPSLQVFLARLQRDISAAHWLVCLTHALDYELVELDPISLAVADSLVSYDINSVSFIGRLCVRLYRGNAVVALASDIADAYPPMAEVLAILVRAVTLGDAKPSARVEPLQRVRLGTLSFELPQSWKTRTSVEAEGGRHATDFTQTADGALVARLRVKSTPSAKADAEQVLARTLEEYRGAGISIQKQPEEGGPLSLAAPFQVAAHYRYVGMSARGAAAFELRVIVIQSPGSVIVVSLLSPDVRNGLYEYAVANRALAITLDSLGTLAAPNQ